jgi:hypothetical protein
LHADGIIAAMALAALRGFRGLFTIYFKRRPRRTPDRASWRAIRAARRCSTTRSTRDGMPSPCRRTPPSGSRTGRAPTPMRLFSSYKVLYRAGAGATDELVAIARASTTDTTAAAFSASRCCGRQASSMPVLSRSRIRRRTSPWAARKRSRGRSRELPRPPSLGARTPRPGGASPRHLELRNVPEPWVAGDLPLPSYRL